MKRQIIKSLLPMIVGFSSFFVISNTFAEGGGGGGGGHSGHGGHDSFFHDIQHNQGHFIGGSSERKHESKRKLNKSKQSPESKDSIEEKYKKYYQDYYDYYYYYYYYYEYYNSRNKQEWTTPGFVTTPLMTNNIINANGLLTIPTIGSTPGLIIFPFDFTTNKGSVSTIPIFSQSDYYKSYYDAYNRYAAYYGYYYYYYYYYGDPYYNYYGYGSYDPYSYYLYYDYYYQDPYSTDPYNATKNTNYNRSVLLNGLNITLPINNNSAAIDIPSLIYNSENSPSVTFDTNGTPYFQIFTFTGAPSSTPVTMTINNP